MARQKMIIRSTGDPAMDALNLAGAILAKEVTPEEAAATLRHISRLIEAERETGELNSEISNFIDSIPCRTALN